MTDASWLERAIIAGILLSSLALFWWRFRKVLKVIRGSRATTDFEVSPLGPRIRQFLWEVMLQGKVIEQRPLPGLAHAFVYWRFLTPDSGFGSFYLGFAAVWALAVAVSIAGLFVRRFVVRPVWLGKVAPESGFIAFLIFTLMATYLAGLWMDEESVAGQGMWWLHTLALLIFLPLIPHTKHLHLVLSPATVFLKRQGFSRIPPLAGDEDFGLDTGKDVTRIDALQAYSCVECGRCTEHCPAAHTGKALNPKEIVLGMRNYLKEFGALNEAPLLVRSSPIRPPPPAISWKPSLNPPGKISSGCSINTSTSPAIPPSKSLGITIPTRACCISPDRKSTRLNSSH